MARRRYIDKTVSKFHPATKLIMAILLAVGVCIGFFACTWFSREDRFVLKGSALFSIDVTSGGVYTYEEEGVEAVCFGLDVSNRLRVETELERDGEGRYLIPTDKEGVYTITYTVDCLKFGEHAPNGVIKRVRVFTVTATEEGQDNG